MNDTKVIRIDTEVYKKVKALAFLYDCTMSEAISKVVRKSLDDVEEKGMRKAHNILTC